MLEHDIVRSERRANVRRTEFTESRRKGLRRVQLPRKECFWLVFRILKTYLMLADNVVTISTDFAIYRRNAKAGMRAPRTPSQHRVLHIAMEPTYCTYSQK